MKIEEKLVELLKEKKYTVSTAESCTGGMVASTIINVAGASEVFNEGYVTYANESKHRILHVQNEILNTVGAVSEECAEQMARGCAEIANANVGLATTGIAGPDGGTTEKPVGLVYVACYIDGDTVVEKHIFKGDREQVRKKAANRAIELVIDKMTSKRL